MTAFDRIERRLPELIEEVASASIPDYFDDMLRQTARARQRPAWSSLERWIPMGVIARPLPVRPIPWRAIVLVALIGLLAAASLAYVGSRQRIPAPFGPARNGALTIGTADGDIVTVDPVTGSATAVISGPTRDAGPAYSNDGQRMVFDRAKSGSDLPALYIADADGSGAREAFPGRADITRFSWAPDSERGVLVETVAGKGAVSIVNLRTAAETALDLDLDVVGATWRPNHDELVLTTIAGDLKRLWVVDIDGSDLREIPVSLYAMDDASVSPDGARVGYSTWDPSRPGGINVVDIDTGGDHSISAAFEDGYVWQGVEFSPDGSRILSHRFVAGTYQSQLGLLDAAGAAEPIMVGPLVENPAPNFAFSPDGTMIVAHYPGLSETWIFDTDGANGRRASFSAAEGITWQRRAP